ncbi:uncharacterized protein M421DRAFT_1566 [Didymella exigua CBS 183.55]|uniref:RRM domain-containing protein n=1 Tax=Didymella exigua CBS 183.55 TaxID=1150837 RepID=A0A6A5S0K7_9PLEO|nr:uncharacterized protein M421DRAFT_1566 [Didymella exigua CBS 183.55]KAF1932994.1 hypothetical protein M421DRAFT_1566 [Didymella exigua CBS 183.55]
MGTVTIGRAYFDALLRRAQFHTSGHEFELTPDLLSNVVISKEEHGYLRQCSRDYALLKTSLFRGGLKTDTLNTLLAGETEANVDDNWLYDHNSERAFVKSKSVPVTVRAPHRHHSPPDSDDTETGSEHIDLPQPRTLHRACSNDQTDSCADNCSDDEHCYKPGRGVHQRIPVHDRRTILITNLTERTTHKDIAGVIRGGRLLDIFIRNDRSATVSFVEGAADFLAYIKRNDIYLHAKRLEFRWADRQFHVPPHISNKIAGGATRNLIVRGVAGRLTEEQIRDHLDHIHNLVVVDIYFQNGDAHISTNSVHNALFARTCMMSRTVYKGTRIDWASDECAAALPQPSMRTRAPVMHMPSVPFSMTNTYALLDTVSEVDSDGPNESFGSNGILLNHNDWASAAVA